MDDVKTKEDLEKMITSQLESEKEMHAENAYIDSLLNEASKNMEVEIDEEIIDDEVERMYADFLNKIAMQGLNEEIYLKYTNTTKEDILKQMRPEAENRVKYRYLLEAIIKEEKISITDKQADKEAEDLSKKYNMSKEDFLKELGGIDALKYDMVMRKAIEVMKESE